MQQNISGADAVLNIRKCKRNDLNILKKSSWFDIKIHLSEKSARHIPKACENNGKADVCPF